MTSRKGFGEAEDPDQWMKDNPLVDDNDLIRYIIHNWRDMEPCTHKVLLCTLMNIVDSDQSLLTVCPFDSEPDDGNSGLDEDTSLSSFDQS